MDQGHGARDLGRLKWIGVILPVAFVWLFEVLRFSVLERAYAGETAHLIGAVLMAGAVLVFALLMASFLERAQRQIVGQNRDLTLTHAVSTAARERLSLPETLGEALAQIVGRTGALAGLVAIDAAEPAAGPPLTLRHPPLLSPGLSWVQTLLDEDVAPPPLAPTWTERRAVDTGILDLPLVRAGERLGRVRLIFHPCVRPQVTVAALADICGEVATAVALGRVVEDLRRREHERAALYEVALQLTGRASLQETLDTITSHARELLGSDRAVVCVAEAATTGVVSGTGGHAGGHAGGHSDGVTGPGPGHLDRLALADDGSTCTFVHASGPGRHARNPACRALRDIPDATFASRPLHSPDGVLGEMCVVRDHGPAFSAAERSLLGALADMAAIAVRTARMHEAEEQYTILSERDRIARELHDSLAQVLGVIHLRLRALEPAVADLPGEPGGSNPVAAELSGLADIADEAYRDVREAILGLRETIASEQGLSGALRDYLKKYTRQTGIRAQLVCDGDVRRAFDPRSEVQLLRVVQEALTNVRKHAGAQGVVVRLDCASSPPIVSIEDDGVGFDPARALASLDGGFGLTSMRERVDQIGGRLDVHTRPGEGTRIIVTLEAGEARVTTAPLANRAGR